jgi:PPOX class probable F420-dependent enzyme
MLDEYVRTLAQGPNFAAFTTMMADGHPQTQIIWVDADDNYVLVNTEIDRVKYSNIKRDPRVTVTIFDALDPYRYAEVRGRVINEVRGPSARRHFDRITVKYVGAPYDGALELERVVLWISPSRQIIRNGN